MNMVKKYSPLSSEFSDLPLEVRDILVHTFDKLDRLHFEKLRELGTLDHPNGNILDYELLAEHQSEDLQNENAMYPSDLNPVLEPNPENGNIDNNNTLNLGDAELNPSLKSNPEDKLEPTDLDISTPTSVPTKPKRNKSKVPPISMQTRAAKLKETLNSDSESDSETKEVSFNTDL